MSQQWYTRKGVNISLHLLFWALFFVSPYLLRPVMDADTPRGPQQNNSGFVYLFFINNLARLTLFYVNAFLLIPRLVYQKKWGQYALTLLLALGLFYLLDRIAFDFFIEGRIHRLRNFFVFNLFPFLFILVASTAFRMIRDRIEEAQRNKEKETENLKTELSFLRSQVSPHFMFNVLNNMVALARKKSDALEPSLIKLSQLLRYMLYETDEEKVLLEKEIGYLQSYIDLQKQRFGKNVVINSCFEKIQGDFTIEPMLLIPFVENAFKHGTGLMTDAEIVIQLKVERSVLRFAVRNRFLENAIETKDKTSGIGLNNVKRRLNLLYRESHLLHIDKADGWFSVSLQLNLH